MARSPEHRRTSTGPRRRELLQALGIFQRATPDQLWKLTRPGNRHDKLTRDNLLDLEDHRLVRPELVREDQRQVWVLTKRGHGEAKQLLEPKGIRVSALREKKYAPVTGKLLGASYDDHAAAVTSTAAALHVAGIGHRLGNGYVQRADLVVRAPEAGVPVLLMEIDRRTEDAHDLIAKVRRYWEWGRLLPKDADKRIVDLVRSRPDAIEWLAVGSGPYGAGLRVLCTTPTDTLTAAAISRMDWPSARSGAAPPPSWGTRHATPRPYGASCGTAGSCP
ncbi:replication-relaxation family protein [Streptomyces sp. NPDC059096]|uniref:replication-relaxation family protein n=1 Tax=Streptomyces sp. NPDC059096 TaxID=3346727 RepID=UPI0036AF7F29